ncbi:MAG: phosphoenolpyruvate--protein phosphotransferase [Candidatus Omnitrophica bacterium]|nr:phosphoenolpyruvate--protein phosphotransferase [Candidatus Omnitrophota bacterium]
MKRDHSKLICDIGELTALFTDTASLDTLLQKIVGMVSAHMEADVCSIYLYYDDSQELVLKATQGLKPSSVGQVRLKLGEGLTGKALLELRPVCEGDARKHPEFRHFTGIGEDKLASFLAVPILRGQTRIGVMVLQSVRKDYFSVEDMNVLRAITSQLANTVEMAKLLMSLESARSEAPAESKARKIKLVKGLVGAQGRAIGEALVVAQASWDDLSVSAENQRSYTLEDLRRAVSATEQELRAMQKEIEARFFDVASLIFSAQIMMLKDRAMLGQMEALVQKGMNPPQAIQAVIRDYAERFERMSNDYIREKRYDVIDVGRRLLEKLTGVSGRKARFSKKIVIARELLPSDALKLSSQGVAGIVLLSGGVTSHIAVLARSLNIPLIVADDRRLLDVPADTMIAIDGNLGSVYVDPGKDFIAKFREREELRQAAAKVKSTVKPRTVTKDGVTVTLLANINLLGDVPVAKDYCAEGVGLYRTEFPFIVRSDFPTEEEQFGICRKLVESLEGKELTFRTLDIGGDKILSYYDYGKEANPFLGLRSIRFSLRHKDIFAQQLRAILRASVGTKARIMFPMISSVDELRAAKAVVADCLSELKAARIPHQVKPIIGVMIEIPSAVESIEELANEAEFFSVGTNDLIQYMLAVDRTNEKVADMYLPHHPAVLRALKRVAEAAIRHGRDISICGDMAHDARYIPFFIGIGIRKFSLDARYLPKVQAAILSLDSREAARMAEDILKCGSVAETAKFFKKGADAKS